MKVNLVNRYIISDCGLAFWVFLPSYLHSFLLFFCFGFLESGLFWVFSKCYIFWGLVLYFVFGFQLSLFSESLRVASSSFSWLYLHSWKHSSFLIKTFVIGSLLFLQIQESVLEPNPESGSMSFKVFLPFILKHYINSIASGDLANNLSSTK